MTEELQLRVLPEVAANEQQLIQYIAQDEGLSMQEIKAVRVLKRSIDARQRTIYVNLKVRAYINELPTDDAYEHTEYPSVDGRPEAIVVGAGPGGLFAALRLIELGVRPILVERGKNVHDRKKDIARIPRYHVVDGESNYCFGEGGAGAYSDGKLYTRSKKRGNVEKILNVFCQHGASTSILSDAHPHIGTDKLPRVIENMRNQIISSGGEVHFQTKMVGFLLKGDKVVGIQTADGKEFHGPVILATGHSARDVYRYLFAQGIDIEAKGLAVGVRLEHPSHLIDQIQYHNREGRGPYLPAAEYSFVQQINGRGVYSFCMCPGGFVVPAASGPQQLVVNGMSPSTRASKWSNSGMVVELHPEDLGEKSLRLFLKSHVLDFPTEEGEIIAGTLDELPQHFDPREANSSTKAHPLSMMLFQESMERWCWEMGKHKQTAPAQRMCDFINGKKSTDLPLSSYVPGLISNPLHLWIPPFIGDRLKQGFQKFGKMSHGFLTNQAVMIGVETRTSSPIRIIRNNETLQHIRIKGLYPCGEGAGYAGGIVSAGVDGERCAEALAAYLLNK